MTKFILKCATCLARTTLPDPPSLFTSGWEARPATGDWVCPTCAATDTTWTTLDDARLSLLLSDDGPIGVMRIVKELGVPWSVYGLALWQLRPAEFCKSPMFGFVAHIAEQFDPDLLGTLFVSKRSETDHVIIDGVHRWTALCQLTDGPSAQALCFVIEGLTPSQEAQIYMALSTSRRPI